MKTFIIALGMSALSIISSAQAEVSIFMCGEMKIETRYLSAFKDPACIAYKKNVLGPDSHALRDQAWIAGTDNQRNLYIEVYEYDPKTPAEYELEGVTRVSILSLNQMPKNSIEHYAFKRNCGLSLLTAKIIDRDTTLLFFDNLTVLKVNDIFPFPQVQTLATGYDPEAAYMCRGNTPSLKDYDSMIVIEEAKRSLTYKNRWGSAVSLNY